MNALLDTLTVWATTRAAGMTSYLLLFFSTAAGIMMSLKMLNGRAKSILLTVHQSSGWFGLLFGMVHGTVLLFDQYVGYPAAELLIPFASHSHRWLNGIGTLSLYAMLILVASSDLMKKLGRKVWRTIHFFAFPAYFMALVHGFMLGSDSHYSWARLMYFSTGCLIVLFTAFRIAAVKFEHSAASGKAKNLS
ncbi:ferric reductase-like transmembrane domain-containing protein [Paenibacillus sp. JX-17]|uniref:Ferric reductase-like transmembrane domain-containing protein n=1 Tax=Paenibacillus lacisoli TaxID=3064525 RepID=A0ABT9C9M0_9BACL|nr:ferric reductase-like transmembrane domain-containing protein [Paenibacillus sp. JX-17]MDO7905957.1 ferric reductase-like transmembrane domain-containing protein [Paenibacillus sp. JX-17]